MKKFILLALISQFVNLSAQTLPTSTVVVDTLHYYFNKYYFKTGATTYSNYPAYKSAASTVTTVTHCGSRFDNSATLTITGLEAFAARGATTANSSIPIDLYLCKLDGSGMPEMPPLGFVSAFLDGSTVNNPKIIGGNFATPITVYGDFAVLFRNVSEVAGDTILLLRTAGATYTNMAALPSQRCSDENYGFVRYNSQFYFTKNFNIAPGFGFGTDYEFMVAPRVTYTIQASHQIPSIITKTDNVTPDTVCTRTTFTFQNTSSYQYTNRFYNLIEFYRKWNLYSAFVAGPVVGGGFNADSAITWNFEYEENALPPRIPHKYLPYESYGPNTGTVSSISDMKGCFTGNQFRSRLKPMSAFGRGSLLAFNVPFTICMKYCNGDTVGIVKNALSEIKLSPNPLIDGRTLISGLKSETSITIFTALGEQIFYYKSAEPQVLINLTNYPPGIYVVRMVNARQELHTLKLIKQK